MTCSSNDADEKNAMKHFLQEFVCKGHVENELSITLELVKQGNSVAPIVVNE